jgi:hypothetical protein
LIDTRHAESRMIKLKAENEALRALTVKLGRIVLTSAGGKLHAAGNVRMPVFDALSPDQIVVVLRELALECERLVRISAATDPAQEFESIGIQFADVASQIEVAFRIPGGTGGFNRR